MMVVMILSHIFLANLMSVCRQQHRRKIPVFRMKMIMMATLIVMMMVVQMTTEVKAEEETLASQPAHQNHNCRCGIISVSWHAPATAILHFIQLYFCFSFFCISVFYSYVFLFFIHLYFCFSFICISVFLCISVFRCISAYFSIFLFCIFDL